jgi:hypothetical protein
MLWYKAALFAYIFFMKAMRPLRTVFGVSMTVVANPVRLTANLVYPRLLNLYKVLANRAVGYKKLTIYLCQ